MNIRLANDVAIPQRCVVVFFPDGMDQTCFDRMLTDGQLPNIQKHFSDGGKRIQKVVSSLPSITYANCSTLITGQFPGHHGILGNLWFDRQTLDNRYYVTLDKYLTVNEHLTSPTLYTILDDHFSVNIQLHTHRGATLSLDGSAIFALNWFFGNFLAVDRSVAPQLATVAMVANQEKRWPSVIMTYYPAVDELGHRYGPDSEEYAEALRTLDQSVGRICEAIEQAGLADRTFYVLGTDHGMVPITKDKQFDLARWLRKDRHLRCLGGPWPSEGDSHRLDILDRHDLFLVVGADRMACIHLRGRQGWSQPVSLEDIQQFIEGSPALHELPAVDCALARHGTDRIRLWSRRGSAMLERRFQNNQRQYRLITEHGDPLGYHASECLSAFAQAGWHSSREWLEATANTEHPDFVPQVVEMFDSSRTGDVVIFAAEGWDFGVVQRGAHGSCLARDMRIPLFIAGPGIRPGSTSRCARLADVTPTLLGLLGEGRRLDKYPNMDGINLADHLLNDDHP